MKHEHVYNPPAHRQADSQKLAELIEAYPFATLITVLDGEPLVSHVPMLLVVDGDHRSLHGHVARANPHWLRQRDVAAPALAIFQASDAYVSPRWYASKAEGGRVVPTWNYRVVHARGTVRFFDDPERLHALVAGLSDVHEAAFDEPWSVADAPDDYVAGQLRGIAGFEMSVESLEGKWKLSQNRSDADRESAIRGLRTRHEAPADEVAAEMERAR